MNKLTLPGLVLAASLALGAPGNALAAGQTLKFAMPGSPHDVHYHKGLIPWAEKVTKESGGDVKFQFYVGHRLAHFGNLLGRLLNKVAHVGFGVHGPTGEPFNKTQVTSLPFIEDDPEIVAQALWNLYANGTIADEHARWKVLALFCFGGNHVHTKKPVTRLEDLAGLKLTVTGKIIGEAVQALGATPVAMAPPEIYQSISRGVVNGVVISWPGVEDFKLHEVTNNHLKAGIGVSSAYVYMNKEVFAGLSARAREAIDHNSGLVFSKKLGAIIKQFTVDAEKKVSGMSGQTIRKISPDELARWKIRTGSVVKHWLATTPNGANVLAAYKAEIAKLRGGN